jgi:ParB-like chromosome segregation protein Spo0J
MVHHELSEERAMHVIMRKITDIQPYASNPRRNDQAVEAVARSIAAFGFRQPIVVDETGTIIVGETRFKAAVRRGLKKVPVHVATGLTPAQIKAYRIADNKTAELADWDQDRLVRELADLQQVAFDIDMLGFSAQELQSLLDIELTQGLADPDQVPEPPDQPVTQPGDLWLLGEEHRLLCGDSSIAADVDRLLDGAVVHLVNMDPP